MRIEVLSIDDCPNSQTAVEEVRDALNLLGRTDVPVTERRITTAEEAAATAFAGSPTVLINGVDVVPGATPIGSLACRVYRTDTGMAGYPTAEQIAEAMRTCDDRRRVTAPQ